MIITIDTNTGQIKIDYKNQLIEKEYIEKTIPSLNTPIQYNQIDIKRKYYKKSDPQYHRKTTKPISKFLKFDRIVKQEPLLEFH